MKKSLFLVFALVGLFLASCNREDINADSTLDDLTEVSSTLGGAFGRDLLTL
jgi:hypothetical protein